LYSMILYGIRDRRKREREREREREKRDSTLSLGEICTQNRHQSARLQLAETGLFCRNFRPLLTAFCRKLASCWLAAFTRNRIPALPNTVQSSGRAAEKRKTQRKGAIISD
jgi:hypothetical protein